jgi:hypothetical protein
MLDRKISKKTNENKDLSIYDFAASSIIQGFVFCPKKEKTRRMTKAMRQTESKKIKL